MKMGRIVDLSPRSGKSSQEMIDTLEKSPDWKKVPDELLRDECQGRVFKCVSFVATDPIMGVGKMYTQGTYVAVVINDLASSHIYPFEAGTEGTLITVSWDEVRK